MAKSVQALITPEVLKWAREEHIRLNLSDAAKKIKVKPEQLERWENGNAQPTIRQLKDIAKCYNIHITVFYLPEPPTSFPPLVDHRFLPEPLAINDEQSYRLRINIIEAFQRREILIDLYQMLDITPPEVTLKIDRNETHTKAAQKIRQFLKFNPKELPRTNNPHNTLKFWKQTVESKGILVCQIISHRSVELETVRGFCIAQRPFPVIVINPKDSAFGKIFTIFHELVHIGLGESAIQNTSFEEVKSSYLNEIEVFCNYVAGATLVPEDELLKMVRSKSVAKNLSEISKHFQVSPEVIMRRLLILNEISDKKYQTFRNKQQKKHKEIQEKETEKISFPGPHYRKLLNASGELLAKTAFSAYYEEKITISELTSIFSNCDTKHLFEIEKSIFA